MGWQDRKYSRTPYDSGPPGGLFNLLNGSVYLGTLFGIQIRMHVTLILFLVFNLMRSGGNIRENIISSAMLFIIILLHEFGHCFAARSVGGEADHILMWPLGGLAYTNTKMRPWPRFVTTAGGPLVNVAICILTGLPLLAMTHFQGSLPINPMIYFGEGALSERAEFLMMTAYNSTIGYYLLWIYTSSLFLLCFNLLPIYPMDGGSMFQEIMWPKLGFYKSMNIACIVGMAGAIIACIAGLRGDAILFFLGISGFMTCYQTRQNLPALSQAAHEDMRYDSYSSPHTKPPKKPRPPLDDQFTLKDLNPFERIARARRKKQFERLFEDDEK